MSQIHPTAIVGPAAELGRDVVLGPGVVIDGPVRIGDATRVLAYAYLTGDTTLGRECEVHPFAAIGGPPQDYGYKGQPSSCVIGDRTIIREHVTIHRGTKPDSVTEVGCDCMLMACSHVAHNCRIEDHVILANNVMLGGYVVVGHHSFLGGGGAIHQFVHIGEYAMIGGVAKATQNVAPFTTIVGRNHCQSINRVGLTRNEFPREDINELRRLHRQILRSRAGVRVSAERQRETVQTPSGRRFIDFILSADSRGVCRCLQRCEVSTGPEGS